MAPRVSVVVAAHNRAPRLGRLLDGLRAQTLPAEAFEVVVVDDGSSDATPAVLAEAAARGDLALKTLRRDPAGGPAKARNAGWRAASGTFVAFTDDDCVPAPDWLERLEAAGADHQVVQGRTLPDPAEEDALGPYARWMHIPDPSPYFETCNIAYPRALLEELGGFDEAFPSPAGEDADLGHRAIAAGARPAFAHDAVVHHAVDRVGPKAALRDAVRATDAVLVYQLHPALRRTLVNGVFYKSSHPLLLQTLAALVLARRSPATLVFALPYLLHLRGRKALVHGGWGSVPFLVLFDAVEVAATARGGLRRRMLVL